MAGDDGLVLTVDLGIDTVRGNLAECVTSVRTGRVVRDERLWG